MVKKSKSEKKSKQSQKTKDPETKELLKMDKSKSASNYATPSESVPLLETPRKSIDDKSVSLTTTL